MKNAKKTRTKQKPPKKACREALPVITPKNLRWCMVAGPQPEWLRAAALDENRTVYMPAAACANELSILLAVAWDSNTPLVIYEGHLYIPCYWVAATYPKFADLADKIKLTVYKHFKVRQ